MAKRTAEAGNGHNGPLKGGQRPERMDIDGEEDKSHGGAGGVMGDFEDDFEDEFESEDEILEAGVDGRPDAEREAEEKAAAMDIDQGTFIVGRNKLEPGQTLAPDLSTYEMLHNLSTPWPCLSFDILRDNLGDSNRAYPATMYTVAGTQADSSRAGENQLIVSKLSGLSRLPRHHGDDSDSDNDDDEDDEDSEPILETRSIPLAATTNRIRAHQIPAPPGSEYGRPPTTLTATMMENAQVLIHDVTPHLASLDLPGAGAVTAQQNKPVSTVRAHKAEGYAVAWSPSSLSTSSSSTTSTPASVNPRLLTGDNNGHIYLTQRTPGGGWVTDTRPFAGHASSVEDLQWSPTEASVFASASSDGTVRIWDVRSKSCAPALSVTVSTTDVNVLSWSRQTAHLLATGADDGVWAAWDLRQWKSLAGSSSSSPSGTSRPQPLANFDYHKEQVTSIEWHPCDDSIVAVAAADHTVTLWDLAVELDEEEDALAGVDGGGGQQQSARNNAAVRDIPPQLLFVHYLASVKELHWHPQLPGTVVATGDEFSVFKTISV